MSRSNYKILFIDLDLHGTYPQPSFARNRSVGIGADSGLRSYNYASAHAFVSEWWNLPLPPDLWPFNGEHDHQPWDFNGTFRQTHIDGVVWKNSSTSTQIMFCFQQCWRKHPWHLWIFEELYLGLKMGWFQNWLIGNTCRTPGNHISCEKNHGKPRVSTGHFPCKNHNWGVRDHQYGGRHHMACHHSNRAEEAAKHRRCGGIAGFSNRRGGIKSYAMLGGMDINRS